MQAAESAQLQLTSPEPKQLTPMEMMAQVLRTQNPKDAVEVVKELAKLQMDMRKQDAEIEFNRALSLCEQELKLVVNDSGKEAPGGKQWATYKALDKELRPLLKKYEIGLSWSTAESSVPEQMIVVAYVSKGLHTRMYQIPMDIGGKGPQGGGALSKPHAIGAGAEYGRRYLIKLIFNLITGDEGSQGVENTWLKEQIAEIKRCETVDGVKAAFRAAAQVALDEGHDIAAYTELKKAAQERGKVLENAQN